MKNLKELKLGPLWFTPGVTGPNLATMLFAAFGTLATISFMSFMQPYVLTELLQIPEEEQGRLTGNLHAFQEVVFIAVAGLIGAASDKAGRPPVYAFGFIISAIAYALYPLASEVWQLYFVRAIFAVGVAGCAIMLSACIVDYIQERSRGRWLGTTSIFNGLGVIAMGTVLSQLPKVYEGAGASTLEAGRFSFWTVSTFALVVALVMYMGLFRGGNKGASDDHVFKKFFAGLKLGVENPRLAIAYGGAFIGRGDFAVIGTFFSFWIVQEGIAVGMTTSEALAIAGPVFGITQLFALLWAPMQGIISDRVHRLNSVAIGLTIAGIGYIMMSQVGDPAITAQAFLGEIAAIFKADADFSIVRLIENDMFRASLLLGMGETGVIVSVGVLMGQEARGENRGAIVGVFGQLGGLGILVASIAGGYLFDGVSRSAPFFMMGALNLVLMVAALMVYFSKHRDAVTTEPATETPA